MKLIKLIKRPFNALKLISEYKEINNLEPSKRIEKVCEWQKKIEQI